jgi:hypothetical protein
MPRSFYVLSDVGGLALLRHMYWALLIGWGEYRFG